MGDMTLLIDPETQDLVFDEDGCFKKIYDADTTTQNVRHTLLSWKSEFFADTEHGTDYKKIMGVNQNDIDEEEIKEILREAVFQEPEVSIINSINLSYDNRAITAEISATLTSGETITVEVTADG